MSKHSNIELIKKAKEAMEFSYSPYSNFKVGACVECEDGRTFTGCNVENISYGATICAERTAIYKAISEGSKAIKKIAIVSSSKDLTFPCGICRQVLSEFMTNGIIILEDKSNNIKEYTMEDILPNSFGM